MTADGIWLFLFLGCFAGESGLNGLKVLEASAFQRDAFSPTRKWFTLFVQCFQL